MSTTIGQAYIQILPSAEGISGSITKLFKGEGTTSGESTGRTFASSFASRAKQLIVSAGIGAAIKQSVDAGANIEQSWGGIVTMFKDDAKTMGQYAKNAYKDAGVSANTYMENVTSFSASLIKGLNGDTKKAANIANTAMIDMSDNANKFGTNISDIQNAYQGFAKQNYTMLDNLKLGYGGTASEMARLINDTGVMGKSFKATAKNMNEVPFDKVIEAIHKTQQEMGITGTTANEAATTISGSFGMMSAAATDFLAALSMMGAGGEMDELGLNVETAFRNMITSAWTFGTNFGSAAGRAIDNAITLIATRAPQMAVEGMNFLVELSKGFVQGIPDFINHALDLAESFADNLAANAPALIQGGFEMLSNLVTGITNAIPILIARAPEIISKFANIINDNAPMVLQKGFQLVVQLAQGIISAIPTLVANIPKILKAIVDVFTAFNWLALGSNVMNLLKNGFNMVVNQVPGVFRAMISGIVKILAGLPSNILNILGTVITKLGPWTVKFGKFALVAGLKFITFIGTALKSLPGKIGSFLGRAITAVATFASNMAKKASEAGRKFLTNVVNGIKSMPSKLASIGSKAISSIAKALNPSKVAAAAKSIVTKAVTTLKTLPGKVWNAVKSVPGKLAKAFKFKISLPKLPKVHITTKTGFLGVKYPVLSWNAKGGVFTGPTIVGNQGFGEAGPEYVLPLNKNSLAPLAALLTEMQGVDDNDLITVMRSIDAKLDTLMRTDKNVYLDKRKLVGAIGPDVEMYLGDSMTRRRR